MKHTLSLLALLLTFTTAFTQISDSSLCDEITKKYDEFEKETTYSTPLFGSYGSPDCSLIKVVSKAGSTTYLSLESRGLTLNVGGTGVKIILSNGQTLSFPSEKIDANAASGSGWTYSAFIKLQPDKQALLRKHKIVKWKLYIYDNSLEDETAENVRNWMNCLTIKK